MLCKMKLLGGFLKGKDIVYCNIFVKPTISIVRKILFDWLDFYLKKARILDIFGGSGILGFEALSRGAKYLIIIEKSFYVCNDLVYNIRNLNLKNVNIVNIDIFKWLELIRGIRSYIKSFDIIFIDPPYNSNYLFCCLDILFRYNYIISTTYVYIESYVCFDMEFFFFKYEIIRFKKLGNIKFYIIRKL